MTGATGDARVVVWGPYPPTADPRGDAVLALVRRLRAEGTVVDVVSWAPSAAPAHAAPGTVAGAMVLARQLRDADRAVLFGPQSVAGRGVAARLLDRALASVGAVEWIDDGPPAPESAPHRIVAPARLRAGAPTALRTALGEIPRRRRRA